MVGLGPGFRWPLTSRHSLYRVCWQRFGSSLIHGFFPLGFEEFVCFFPMVIAYCVAIFQSSSFWAFSLWVTACPSFPCRSLITPIRSCNIDFGFMFGYCLCPKVLSKCILPLIFPLIRGDYSPGFDFPLYAR